VEELPGDRGWPRDGVLGHVSNSMPLVIPYQSAGAMERTPGPKPNWHLGSLTDANWVSFDFNVS